MNPLDNLQYDLQTNHASDILSAKQLADQAIKNPAVRHEYFDFLKTLREKKGPEYSTAVHQYASKLLKTKRPDIYPVEESNSNTALTYAEVRKAADDAMAATNTASKALQQFPKGNMGLVPDDVKSSPEWQAAKQAYNNAFAKERAINQFMNKNFKKEVRNSVNQKRLARSAPVEETIVKTDGDYELKSKSGRNLGKYPTKAGAEKREQQVNYFKHANEDIVDEARVEDLKEISPEDFVISVNGNTAVIASKEPRGQAVTAINRAAYAARKTPGVTATRTQAGRDLTDPKNMLKFTANKFTITTSGNTEQIANSIVATAIKTVNDELARRQESKAGAPARNKAASKFSAQRKKASDAEIAAKLGLTPADMKRVTFRQVGGDDGYQYNVFIDGRSIVNGLTLGEVPYYKMRAYEIIAKKKGAVTESTESVAQDPAEVANRIIRDIGRNNLSSWVDGHKLDNLQTASDKYCLKYMLTNFIPGISDLTITDIYDESAGVRFSFRANGQIYGGTWFPEEGNYYCSVRKPAAGLAEDSNPTDAVTVDVPLLIRLLEYSREDANTDMDLHNIAEKLIELSAQGNTLTMQDYDSIVGTN